MTPPFLRGVFDAAYLLALAAWAGGALFVRFGLPPVALAALGPEGAERLGRELIGRMYAWGAVCGAIALPAYIAVPLSFPEYRGPVVGLVSLVILGATIAMIYGGNGIAPAIAAALAEGPEGHARLARLRRRARAIDLLVVLVGGLLIVAHAGRPAPATAGIVEPSPEEWARRSYEEAARRREAFDRATPPIPARPMP